MTLVPIRWRPDRKTLAEFSEVGMFALGMVAAPLAYARGRHTLAATCWVAAVALRLLGLWRPSLLRPVFVGLTLATWPVGWVVSNVALALLYYGVVTPIALAGRLVGRDPLARRFDRQAVTYWEPYRPSQSVDRYLKQF